MKIAALLLSATLLAAASPVRAHDGHDHGDAAPKPVALLAPRAESATQDFELLLVAGTGRFTLYLDRFATNEPVVAATVDVESGPNRARAKEVAPGTYEAQAPWLTRGTRHDLIVTVEAGTTSDLLPVTLDMPAAAAAAPAPHVHTLAEDLIEYGTYAAGAVVLVLGVVLLLRRRRAAGTVVVLLFAVQIMAPREGQAHEGHDHGPPPAPPTAEQPSRLADGSVFVPKPSQRVLGLRTVQVVSGKAVASVELNGHVVADPNGAGRVQAPQPGRIEPGPRGLPHLGQRVARGEVLAWLVPTVAALDAANQRSQLAALAAELDLAEKRHARLVQLEGSVPRREIEAAANAVTGLQQRRAAAAQGLGVRVPLVAPVAGQVSLAAATAGQVVDARDTLLEIVDTSRLLIDALAYDPGLPAKIRAASGVTSDGRTLALTLLGHGAALREHAVPIAFRVGAGVQGLAVGQPIRVLAQVGDAREAILVPADALVKDGAGGSAVWVHAAAERFVLRRVRSVPHDATTAAVLEGIAAQDRVVTRGASLLGQVR